MLDAYKQDLISRSNNIREHARNVALYQKAASLFPEDSEYIERVKADLEDEMWALNDSCVLYDRLRAKAIAAGADVKEDAIWWVYFTMGLRI